MTTPVKHNPTVDEIREQCQRIRESWPPAELSRREGRFGRRVEVLEIAVPPEAAAALNVSN